MNKFYQYYYKFVKLLIAPWKKQEEQWINLEEVASCPGDTWDEKMQKYQELRKQGIRLTPLVEISLKELNAFPGKDLHEKLRLFIKCKEKNIRIIDNESEGHN